MSKKHLGKILIQNDIRKLQKESWKKAKKERRKKIKNFCNKCGKECVWKPYKEDIHIDPHLIDLIPKNNRIHDIETCQEMIDILEEK
jgi:hypothetical protein